LRILDQRRSGALVLSVRTVSVMSLYVIRHASAGDRGFGPDDRLRGLDDIGRARADQLATLLGPTTGRILSSPFARCIQTVEPLANRTGRSVEQTTALGEAQPFEPVLELLAAVADQSVLCSHGDLIPDVIDALIRRGADLQGAPSWKKGSVWVLDRVGGNIVTVGILRTEGATSSSRSGKSQ
jgi:8-oxo-dGTP diphosphatase